MDNFWYIIIGISVIFLATTLGAAVVYLFKKEINPKINSVILGFASGVMIAASVFGLIMPAIDRSSEAWGVWRFVPAAVGIIIGGAFLVVIDKLVPHLHKGTNIEEGLKSNIAKPYKLFLAVTIHNIPEGLAVGLAFGAAIVAGETAVYLSALSLAIGIAIQNFPEGAAVSLPMRTELNSRNKGFLFGMGSGAVEPVAALIGILLATQLSAIMPWMLGFAAGAMLFVVAEDLIPDAKMNSDTHLGTWGFMIGFVVMMILDVALG